jgi:hypothetical protein
MNNTETLTYISIAVIAISLFFIGTNLTGFAVTDNETGLVNVTIVTSAALNFSTALFDFGSGTVNDAGARLWSNGTNISGTWNITPGNLVLENVGNTDVSLNLSANKSAQQFIGAGAEFRALVTENETGSCGSPGSFNTYEEITTTPVVACGNFPSGGAMDSINISFELYIPSDAFGAKTVEIIAIGEYGS